MSFRLVGKSVTLNDVERHNNHSVCARPIAKIGSRVKCEFQRAGCEVVLM